MNSFQYRNSALFLRSGFRQSTTYQFPIIRRQQILLPDPVQLIAWSDTRKIDRSNNNKIVHFFIDDYRFTGIYRTPERYIQKLSQYYALLSPDFSTYGEMPTWRQIESIAMSRWCGAYWQACGLSVIPTVTWADTNSFSFCFEGVEKGSTVAISTIGCKKNNKDRFMQGFNQMIKILNPERIICFGTPFPEMNENILVVNYIESRKGNRNGR